jgi:hypothetical protein
MTKRDFIFLLAAPIILLAIASDLLWLSGKLHDGAEHRLADSAVLQDRISGSPRTDSASRSSERAALTLSRLVMQSQQSEAATVNVSISLAVLLFAVSLFQFATVLRLLRNQQKLTSVLRQDPAASKNPTLRPSGVGAARTGLSNAGNHTLL